MSAGEQIFEELAAKAIKNTTDLLRECAGIDPTPAEQKLVKLAVGCAIEVMVKEFRAQPKAPMDYFAE